MDLKTDSNILKMGLYVQDEIKLGHAVQHFQQEHKKGYMSAEVKQKAEEIEALWQRITR